jgi:hypothetical protein
MPLNEALIASRMRQYESFSSEQLLQILQAGDAQRYAPEDFEAIRRLLTARNVPLPLNKAQNGWVVLLIGAALVLGVLMMVLFWRSLPAFGRPTSSPTPMPVTPPPTSTAELPVASPTSVWAQLNTPPEKRILDWPLVASEDFNDNHYGWVTGDGETTVLRQAWWIENGVYLWQVKALQANASELIVPTIDAQDDFYLALKLQKVKGAATANAGLVFRKQDNANYYAFLVNDTGGDFQIALLLDGQWKILKDWTPSTAIRYGGPNKLAVLAEGPMLKFYINERLVAQLANDALSTGQMGVMINLSARSDSALFQFDDFELRAP